MIQLYLILSFLVFLGFIVGMIIGKIAPEELTDGAPWFIKIQDTSFLIVVLLLGYYHLANYTIIVLLLVLFFYWCKNWAGSLSKLLEYVMLGILFGISYQEQYFMVSSTLLFVYGLAAGGLFMHKSHNHSFLRMSKETFIRLFYFLIGALLPFYIAYL